MKSWSRLLLALSFITASLSFAGWTQQGDGSATFDAKGTAVAGNDEKGSRLGSMLGQAVQEIIIREKRPGGLLHN